MHFYAYKRKKECPCRQLLEVYFLFSTYYANANNAFYYPWISYGENVGFVWNYLFQVVSKWDLQKLFWLVEKRSMLYYDYRKILNVKLLSNIYTLTGSNAWNWLRTNCSLLISASAVRASTSGAGFDSLQLLSSKRNRW